jgi:hypothetical protein
LSRSRAVSRWSGIGGGLAGELGRGMVRLRCAYGHAASDRRRLGRGARRRHGALMVRLWTCCICHSCRNKTVGTEIESTGEEESPGGASGLRGARPLARVRPLARTAAKPPTRASCEP